MPCRFSDKEVQRDAKLVSYDVVEKNTKPYVQVQIGSENKVRHCMQACGAMSHSPSACGCLNLSSGGHQHLADKRFPCYPLCRVLGIEATGVYVQVMNETLFVKDAGHQ